MKTKINQKPKTKLQLNPIDENGYPIPKKVKCFRPSCKQWFWLKFVIPQRNYSLKNNWGYWTSKTEDKKKSTKRLPSKNYCITEKVLKN